MGQAGMTGMAGTPQVEHVEPLKNTDGAAVDDMGTSNLLTWEDESHTARMTIQNNKTYVAKAAGTALLHASPS